MYKTDWNIKEAFNNYFLDIAIVFVLTNADKFDICDKKNIIKIIVYTGPHSLSKTGQFTTYELTVT